MAYPAELRKTLHTKDKNEHFEESLPVDSIPLTSLKILEEEFKKRGIVNNTSSYPLWFHAETERNIYLWRCGYSLMQADDFEFWIDVEKLLNKRLKQLETQTNDNPFSNPLWANDMSDENLKSVEREYLLELKEAFSKISHHAHALGQVITQICEVNESERETILLPVGRK